MTPMAVAIAVVAINWLLVVYVILLYFKSWTTVIIIIAFPLLCVLALTADSFHPSLYIITSFATSVTALMTAFTSRDAASRCIRLLLLCLFLFVFLLFVPTLSGASGR